MQTKKILERYNVGERRKMKLSFPTIPLIDTHNNSTRFTKVCLMFILLIAAAVRFGYLIQLQSNPLPFCVFKWQAFDQYRFMELVNKFVEGNWIGPQATRYSPAYSYLIAILFKVFSNNLNILFVFQMVVGIIAVYVSYRAAGYLFGNKKVGLIAAFITALYSPLIFYEGTMVRASLIAYFNLICFYFLLKAIKKRKPKHIFLSGLTLGISMVLRPNILPLFIVPYLFIAIKKTFKYKMLYIVLFVLGLTLVVSPLVIRNRMLGSNVLISYQGPSSFWIGNTYDSAGIGLPRREMRSKLAAEAGGSITKTFTILIREIARHPREYRELYLRKLKMFLNGYEIPANLSYDLFKENHSMLRVSFFNFTIICPLALLGIFLIWNRHRHSNNSSILYLFLYVLSFSVIAFHIQGRYRIPSVPFYIMLSSYTIYWIIYMTKERKFTALSIAFIVLAVISIYTKPARNIITKHFESYVRNIDYNNLALGYIEKSEETRIQKQEKDRLLRKAADNLGKAVFVPNLFYKINYLLRMGEVHCRLGQYEEAISLFDRVLVLDPDNKIAAEYINWIKKMK